MEVPDELIIKYFELATDEHPSVVEEVRAQLASGTNPRDIKLKLAHIITGLYHGEKAAEKAHQFFQTAFQKDRYHLISRVSPLKLEQLSLRKSSRT